MSGDIAKIACLLHDASQSRWPSSVSTCCMNSLNVMLAPCLEFNTSCKRAACVNVTIHKLVCIHRRGCYVSAHLDDSYTRSIGGCKQLDKLRLICLHNSIAK